MNTNFFVIYRENCDSARIVKVQNREKLAELGFCKKGDLVERYTTIEEAQEFCELELCVERKKIKYWH